MSDIVDKTLHQCWKTIEFSLWWLHVKLRSLNALCDPIKIKGRLMHIHVHIIIYLQSLVEGGSLIVYVPTCITRLLWLILLTKHYINILFTLVITGMHTPDWSGWGAGFSPLPSPWCLCPCGTASGLATSSASSMSWCAYKQREK